MASVRQHPSEGTPHCLDHCGSCGAHFRGIGAFDKHRVGSFPKGTRRCRKPSEALRASEGHHGEPWLEIVTDAGICDLAHGKRLTDATIWRMASDDDD